MIRFLLKYVSRDEVSVLGKGTGGISEVRSAVESYEEKSPLYGFLQYRRRKVILKYVPEGMSRLLQGTYGPGRILVPSDHSPPIDSVITTSF